MRWYRAWLTLRNPWATQPPPGTVMVVAAAPEGVNVHVPASDITVSPVAPGAGQLLAPPLPPPPAPLLLCEELDEQAAPDAQAARMPNVTRTRPRGRFIPATGWPARILLIFARARTGSVPRATTFEPMKLGGTRFDKRWSSRIAGSGMRRVGRMAQPDAAGVERCWRRSCRAFGCGSGCSRR